MLQSVCLKSGGWSDDPVKLFIVNGSPRGRRGNTHIMVEAFSDGASRAGADIDHLFLNDLDIHECLGCFSCWTARPGECVQKDRMEEILTPAIECDVLILATPLYFDNVTGLMKIFLDRLIAQMDPRFELDDNGEYRHVKRFDRHPDLGIISNCGFPEQSHFQVLKLLCRRMARNMHADLVLEIYRGAGELLSADNLLLKPVIGRYLKLLRSCGEEFVHAGRLSEKTIKRLDKPLIPHDAYIRGANRYWDKSKKKRDTKVR